MDDKGKSGQPGPWGLTGVFPNLAYPSRNPRKSPSKLWLLTVSSYQLNSPCSRIRGRGPESIRRPHSHTVLRKQLIEYFKSQMKEDPDMASAVAAIRTLLEFLKRDKGETIQGLRANLTNAIETLCGVDSSVAVSSGGELFLRFISLTSLEYSDYSKCKKIMIERGELFLRRISLSRNKIADLCHTFIKDGARILTHASSRVVLRVLEAAVAAKKRFHVYITESQPDLSGQVPPTLQAAEGQPVLQGDRDADKKMAKALCHLNVPVTVVLDAAVGYIMEKADLVIVGAEGVVENGGIINKIGTNQMAVCAKAQNKPFYVVAESFKFVRLFPLNQQDVPDKFKAGSAGAGVLESLYKFSAQCSRRSSLPVTIFCDTWYKADTLKSAQTRQDLKEEHPWVDYTAPSLITLLFTDLGVLTPSAVSDELIKLYL
ncbi:Translation initiation factor eIF-2B subunit alpha [Fukomys damarensis]|uniref:Translation initiation factor eIF2B subunit alpha n=1 Tax=Fukomys damarensis TaxID=885580 RepID=A0A091CZ34_FUKDA|nr:Translation initiation factor eIF-2B subunit alpha [Fukomys damarensis]